MIDIVRIIQPQWATQKMGLRISMGRERKLDGSYLLPGKAAPLLLQSKADARGKGGIVPGFVR